MAVSNRLQVVHFHHGKDIYKLNVPQELSKKLLEDKEFAIGYLRQMVKQQQQSSSKVNSVNESAKKKVANQGQISLLQIPITISSEESSLVSHQQWPVEAAKLLLQEYKSKLNDFNGGVRKKKDIWADIHLVMRTFGCTFTQENCEKKFRNMKASYLSIRERNIKLGRNTSKWEFYDEMEEIFGNGLIAIQAQGNTSGSSSADQVKSVITVLADSDSVPHLMSDDETMETDIKDGATILQHFSDSVDENVASYHCNHKQNNEPPPWFSTFLKQFNEVEERKLEELKKIHEDNVQLLRQRNELLERLNQTIGKFIK